MSRAGKERTRRRKLCCGKVTKPGRELDPGHIRTEQARERLERFLRERSRTREAEAPPRK